MPQIDVFPSSGEEIIADLVAGEDWYIWWGDGSGDASKASTGLLDPRPGTRVMANLLRPAADTNRFSARLQVPAPTSVSITNAGVFETISGGRLLLHSTFDAVDLSPGEAIVFDFEIQWS